MNVNDLNTIVSLVAGFLAIIGSVAGLIKWLMKSVQLPMPSFPLLSRPHFDKIDTAQKECRDRKACQICGINAYDDKRSEQVRGINAEDNLRIPTSV